MGIGSGSLRSRSSKSVLYWFADPARRRYPFVQRSFTRRPRLPAPVDPEPLIRILADHALEDRMQAGGVGAKIARDRDLGIKAQHQFPLLLRPEPRTWDHGCGGMSGDVSQS